MKEIENTNKKDILLSWFGRINIAEMFTIHKAFYRLNAIFIKIPMVCFS